MTVEVFLHGFVAASWIALCTALWTYHIIIMLWGELYSLKISVLQFMFSEAQEKYDFVLICLLNSKIK